MKYKTIEEYQKEITRVKVAIDKTDSDYLKKDYNKYLKRLKNELKILKKDRVNNVKNL